VSVVLIRDFRQVLAEVKLLNMLFRLRNLGLCAAVRALQNIGSGCEIELCSTLLAWELLALRNWLRCTVLHGCSRQPSAISLQPADTLA